MPSEIIMPQLGESVFEATVTKWLKVPGETVKEYEPLLEVNTDKVDTEIPSTVTGTLLEILIPEGTTVRAGTVLARIGASDAVRQAERSSPAKHIPPGGMTELGSVERKKAPVSLEGETYSHAVGRDNDLGFISPVVARIVRENHLDLARVKGTGLGGRITKKDVLAYLDRMQAEGPMVENAGGLKVLEPPPAPSLPSPEVSSAAAPISQSPTRPASTTPGEILPLTPVRRLIAEHMVMSKHISPHVTTVMEADLSRVVAHRATHKAAFSRDGVHLTYTAYFIAAAVAAIKALPMANSSWSEAGILLHRQINIGIATSLGEEGLIVPVLKEADSFSLLGLARAVNDLANRARAHRLQPEEVRGGTFTITNHGTSGSLFATPIINQPQVAILGVGAIQKRVVVIETPGSTEAGIENTGLGEAIAIRPMIYLTLTFDHRVLDGAMGDYFLGKVVEFLQNFKGELS